MWNGNVDLLPALLRRLARLAAIGLHALHRLLGNEAGVLSRNLLGNKTRVLHRHTLALQAFAAQTAAVLAPAPVRILAGLCLSGLLAIGLLTHLLRLLPLLLRIPRSALILIKSLIQVIPHTASTADLLQCHPQRPSQRFPDKSASIPRP